MIEKPRPFPVPTPTKIPKLKFKELEKLFKDNKLPIINPHMTRDLRIDWEWTEIPTPEQFQLAANIAANLETGGSNGS